MSEPIITPAVADEPLEPGAVVVADLRQIPARLRRAVSGEPAARGGFAPAIVEQRIGKGEAAALVIEGDRTRVRRPA